MALDLKRILQAALESYASGPGEYFQGQRQERMQERQIAAQKEIAGMKPDKEISVKESILQKKQRGEILTPGEDQIYKETMRRPEDPYAAMFANFAKGNTSTPTQPPVIPKVKTISRKQMAAKGMTEQQILEMGKKEGVTINFID